jgi:hypothetical protein
MSAQVIQYQERKGNGAWRYAVLAFIVAIALTVAIAMATAGGAAKTTSGGSSTGGNTHQTTIVVPGGPAAGHPLP